MIRMFNLSTFNSSSWSNVRINKFCIEKNRASYSPVNSLFRVAGSVNHNRPGQAIPAYSGQTEQNHTLSFPCDKASLSGMTLYAWAIEDEVFKQLPIIILVRRSQKPGSFHYHKIDLFICKIRSTTSLEKTSHSVYKKTFSRYLPGIKQILIKLYPADFSSLLILLIEVGLEGWVRALWQILQCRNVFYLVTFNNIL